MNSTPVLKRRFQESLRTVAARHRSGKGGIAVSLLLTKALDDILLRVFRASRHPSKSLLCIIATGGYGRKELCFASDTDIMFLLPEGSPPEVGFAVQGILHDLLDLGLDIGHSVRTISDCTGLCDSDLDSWVSVLESRFLCGDRALFAQFRTRLRRHVQSTDKAAFVRDLLARTQARHAKYGQSSRLLEPNVKNSAGGLRDLHTTLWLLLGTGSIPLFSRPASRSTAVTHMLTTPFVRAHLPAGQVREVRSAFDFLLRTRNAMHLESKGLHDSLDFTFQRQVAESLRYGTTQTRSSVERFMQRYYVATRAITRFSRRMIRTVEAAHTTEPIPPAKVLDRQFVLVGGRIVPRKRVTISNMLLLRALRYAQEHKADFAEQFEDALVRQMHHVRALRSRGETAAFRALVNADGGVAGTLRAMNDLGVLERWIPEWKPLVAFFQHSQYHFYTADEHTLRAVATAESLQDDRSPLGDAFRSLPRRDTLYYACLFHDITKPLRVVDHEYTGAETAGVILRRLHMNDIADDVSFLVRHHLLMEQVAFRRNLNDPQTIIDFTSKIPRVSLLDYLYVLTYADLTAVNRSVWTDWKGMLLFELYRKSRETLERQMSMEQIRSAVVSRRSQALREVVRTLAGVVPEESSHTHLEAVDTAAYLEAFDAEEIAEHIKHIEQNTPVSAIFRHAGTLTEITVIARDAPYALSRFCGVLSANDANILDAHIFTRNDGIIIDKFRVSDFLQHSRLTDAQCEKVRRELIDVMTGTTDILHLLHRHRMKWKRLKREHNPNTRIGVEFEDHPVYTIIDVFAPDRLGFLYRITETISGLGLNIHSAKIATRADGIVDSFYVLDRNGGKIDDPSRRAEIQHNLLQAVEEAAGSELTPSSS
ncbi:MAG: bifunctional uridylyltransferase/uridylyl-removing enzyme [Bacteroidia bacterium]|nr:MAG: bifunctional uridylyltransferase/uridylyl-removing enzyme [Bacteroidia bacterium]